MSSRALTLGFSLIAGFALATFGCSSSAAGGSGCVTGQNFVCACGSGSQGVQTCRADNTLGDCNCTQASLLGGNGGSSPTQSGTPGGGNSGTGSGGSASGGAGGTPAMMGGPAGMGGGTPPGTGGTTGVAGNSGPGGGRPPAGTPYSFCATNADCGTSGTCSTTTRGTVTTGYCSPSCGPLRPCGKPPSGDVTASCMLTTCTLGSCESANCPEGMNCVQTRTLGQTTYSCQYPVR